MRLSPHLAPNEEQLARAIQELMGTIHKNEYGFPLGIYRPDLLPLENYQPEADAADKLYEGALLEHAKPRRQKDIRARLFDEDGFDPLSVMEDGDNAYASWEEAPQEETWEETWEESESEAESEHEVSREERRHRGSGRVEYAVLSEESVQVEPGSKGDTARIAGFLREDLKAAFVPLNYDQGFPTMPDGKPFWEQFEFEPTTYFTALQAYLQMPLVSDGVRNLNDLSVIMEENELLDITGFTHREYSGKFQVISQIYLWPLRARAYDLYKAASYKKKMEFRAMQVQDSHYTMSTRLLNRLATYMESEQEFWDVLTPKVCIDMLKALVAMQRLSAGLPASAPAKEGGEGVAMGGQTFEMLLRTLAQQGGAQEVAKIGADQRLSARILEDPDTTQIAQELILKMLQQERGT